MFYQFGQQRNLRGGSTERGLHEVIKGGVNGASGVPQGPPGPFGIAPTGGNGGISVLFRGPVDGGTACLAVPKTKCLLPSFSVKIHTLDIYILSKVLLYLSLG